MNKSPRPWIKALERSPLKPDDLNRIPFTLLVPNCPITFMEHKRCVVHIARQSAESMHEFMGRALPINIDTVIAGAILADVGKLLEYEIGPDGKSRQSSATTAPRVRCAAWAYCALTADAGRRFKTAKSTSTSL
ncbi:MAG: hypothetical protein WBE44_02535 [Terriglobales bacterium]|jgi:hypothetical protein